MTILNNQITQWTSRRPMLGILGYMCDCLLQLPSAAARDGDLGKESVQPSREWLFLGKAKGSCPYLCMFSSSFFTFSSSSSDCFLLASSSSAEPAGIPCSSHFSRRAFDCNVKKSHILVIDWTKTTWRFRRSCLYFWILAFSHWLSAYCFRQLITGKLSAVYSDIMSFTFRSVSFTAYSLFTINALIWSYF